jgi:hypothetical protein
MSDFNYKECYEEVNRTHPPLACIHCGSEDITTTGHAYTNEHQEYIDFWHCVSCGKEWDVIYTFKEIKE